MLTHFTCKASATTNETSNETTSCTPPADMKTLEECCHSPILFEDDLHGTCEFFCSEDKKESKNPDCSFNCLFKNNGIMRKGDINKTALENTFDKFGLANPNWRPITATGVAKCPIVYSDTNFKENVEKFEQCMTDNYRHHCIEYNPEPDCDKVEDFMNKCQNVKPDCNTWPKWIVKLPEKCCKNKPKLFNEAMMNEANRFCQTQGHLSNLGLMQCLATFLINATGIKPEGKWHFETATKLLSDHSGKDPKWTSAIEKTVETCEKQVHGSLTMNYFLLFET